MLSKVDWSSVSLVEGGGFATPICFRFPFFPAFVLLSFLGDAAGRRVSLRRIHRHAFRLVGFPWSICVCVSLIDYSIQHSCGGGIPHVVAVARTAHVWPEYPATQ